MNIFSKKKDLILKLTNLVLMLWLVGSIVFTYTSLASIIMPKELLTYDEYQLNNCYYDNETDDSTSTANYCLSDYERYKSNSDDDYNNKRNLFTFIGSGAIVYFTMYLLNKNAKIKSKRKGAKK